LRLMLTDLVVEGMGVFERAELWLDERSTVLTGETGAGKTLVVAAASLLLGDRAPHGVVRAGCREARVEGRFVLPSSSQAVAGLVRAGVVDEPSSDEVELVVTRVVHADSRPSKARINGRLVTLGVLAEAAEALVAIAGQREHHSIGGPSRQRAMLDNYAGPGARALAVTVAESVSRLERSRARLGELLDSERSRRRELDSLRHEITELEKAGIESGEKARLIVEADRLEHSEAIAEGLAVAREEIEAEWGAEAKLAAARKALDAAGTHDAGLESLAKRLETAAYELRDVAEALSVKDVTRDPAALEQTRARLAEIARLCRKYGDDEGEVLAYLARAKARRTELESGDLDRASLEGEIDELERAARHAAEELGRLRRRAGPKLAREVERRLADLALQAARFEVRITPCDLYEGGLERVELWVAPNPGETAGPVSQIASGGELSRIALALHLLQRPAQEATTLIFDEIDQGVGGKAALAVGRCLAELARSGSQVVTITHLPQVAAFADAHLMVSKLEVGKRTLASVEAVEGPARVTELSRMLAGLPEGEGARRHAEELLALASDPTDRPPHKVPAVGDGAGKL
jgi:DNA repair protein RecN (Recombination protein N)